MKRGDGEEEEKVKGLDSNLDEVAGRIKMRRNQMLVPKGLDPSQPKRLADHQNYRTHSSPAHYTVPGSLGKKAEEKKYLKHSDTEQYVLEFCEFCAAGLDPMRGVPEDELLAGDGNIGSMQPAEHRLGELLKQETDLFASAVSAERDMIHSESLMKQEPMKYICPYHKERR